MEYLKNILDLIFNYGGELIFNFMIYGFIGSMVGLFGTIVLIKKRKKAGKLDRPFLIWRAFMTLERIYLPVVAMVAFGILSSIFGVNTKINESIETGIHTSIDKISISVRNIKRINRNTNYSLSPEEILIQELNSKNSIKILNNIIAKAMINKLNNPATVDVLINELNSTKWMLVKKGLHFGISFYISDVTDVFFWAAYRYIIVILIISFLKIPILEAIVFFIYKNIFGNNKGSSYSAAHEIV